MKRPIVPFRSSYDIRRVYYAFTLVNVPPLPDVSCFIAGDANHTLIYHSLIVCLADTHHLKHLQCYLDW